MPAWGQSAGSAMPPELSLIPSQDIDPMTLCLLDFILQKSHSAFHIITKKAKFQHMKSRETQNYINTMVPPCIFNDLSD